MTRDLRIQRRATAEQKEAWRSFCDAHGVSEAEMLGRLLDKVTDGRTGFSDSFVKEPRTSKITVRLSPGQMKKAGERALQEGFLNRTKWLTSLAMAALDREAVLTEAEVNALRESNRELAAIGRNLNQIARALNTEFRESDRLTREFIERLAENIESHKDTTAALLNRNLDRWGSSDG